MTKSAIVLDDEQRVGEWLQDKLGITWTPGRGRTISYQRESDGVWEILAAVSVEDFNGPNCVMHVAALPGRKWCTPTFLKVCFQYVFRQLGCHRITGLVDETNTAARQLDEHLGFELETRLKGAAPGGDLLVYVMWRDKCRWIRSNQDELRQG